MTCFTSSRARDLERTPPRTATVSCAARPSAPDPGQGASSPAGDRFLAPTGGGRYRSTLVLAIGPFRDWLHRHMAAHELTAVDVAQSIRIDEAVVRGWFGVRPRDWREHTRERFVVHTISESMIEAVGIALAANPRLAAELYPHLAEPVCQHCGAPAGCTHLGQDLQLRQPLAA
jgi:hypothetical protein